MIKFFRRIRQRLLGENRFSKYLVYAIGEIVLVVIGILIALQINNWNETSKDNKKEIAFLNELRKNIESDINYFIQEDSIRANYEEKSDSALLMIHHAKDYDDLLSIDSLFTFRWGDWEVSRSVYEEMLNTGSLYGLKNDNLKDKIANYYKVIETRVYAIKKIDDVSIKLSENTPLYQLDLLRNNSEVYDGKLDDSWITDPNSPEFMSLYKFYRFTNQNCNSFRRAFVASILNEGQELLQELNKELGRIS